MSVHVSSRTSVPEPVSVARVRKAAHWLALVTALACATFGGVFVVRGVAGRAYTAVETEALFQAQRVRDARPLYVDPAVGAWEDGAPPSRYYVLYPPLYPWLLAHSAPRSASLVDLRTVGRTASVALLVLTLAFLVRGARTERRAEVLTGALLVLGLHMIAREVALAQADVLAVTLAIVGFARASRAGRLDPLSAVLLAAAPFVKPNVLGCTVGAFVAHVVAHRRSGARALLAPLAVGAAVAAGFVALYHTWSDGAWLQHIARATGQPLTWEKWRGMVASRALILGAPHAVVLAVAIRRRCSPLATLPLAASLAWTLFAVAKTGSATYYWIEPTLAAIVTLGRIPSGPPARPLRVVLPLAGLALSVAVALSSIPGFLAGATDASFASVVEEVDRLCPRAPGEVAMSSDVRLELALNGRVIVPAWQGSYMVRTGDFPLAAWRASLEDDHVRCVVAGAYPGDETSAYDRELKDVLEARFAPVGKVGWVRVLARR
jgi:hypothetical protein